MSFASRHLELKCAADGTKPDTGDQAKGEKGRGKSIKESTRQKAIKATVPAFLPSGDLYGGAVPIVFVHISGTAPAVSVICSVLFDTTSRTVGRSTGLRLAPHMGIAPLRGSLRAAPIACVCRYAEVPL